MTKLIFNYATMGAGKTIDLLRTAYNYEENNKKVIILKPEIDTKGNDKIVTRIGISRKVDYVVPQDERILALLKGEIENVNCILVDEAQFFNKNQIKDLKIIATFLEIPVICYGLRTNVNGELFEGSLALMACADEINEFKALCRCGEIARYNARKINGKYDRDGNKTIIDGTENVTYEPLCPDCFLSNVERFDKEKVKTFMKTPR